MRLPQWSRITCRHAMPTLRRVTHSNQHQEYTLASCLRRAASDCREGLKEYLYTCDACPAPSHALQSASGIPPGIRNAMCVMSNCVTTRRVGTFMSVQLGAHRPRPIALACVCELRGR